MPMNALWLENQILSYRNNVNLTSPTTGEALVKVRLAGICTTDLEMVKGYHPFTGVPGHEFVGEVVESVSSPEWIDKRIVAEINLVCGKCEACLHGRSNHCQNRKSIGIDGHDGCFGEFITLPLTNLHLVPESVSDEKAVFVEPLAAASQILEQVHVHPGMRVLVIGAGRLGVLCAMVLSLTGCDLKVVVRQPRTKKILEDCGICTVSNQDVTPEMADLVVEVTGSADGFAQARQAVRGGGTMVLKSTFKGETTLDLSALVVEEISLIGSRCGSFMPAIRLLESGQIDPTPLIDASYAFQDGMHAFEHAARRGVLKVLLHP
jgi:threonine dehydrogenase-like Zn-dependent dehydrogenase